MADKFIPDRDIDFVVKAEAFAAATGRHPHRYRLSSAAVEEIARAAVDLRAKYSAAQNKFTRSRQTLMEREEARADAKRAAAAA